MISDGDESINVVRCCYQTTPLGRCYRYETICQPLNRIQFSLALHQSLVTGGLRALRRRLAKQWRVLHIRGKRVKNGYLPVCSDH